MPETKFTIATIKKLYFGNWINTNLIDKSYQMRKKNHPNRLNKIVQDTS